MTHALDQERLTPRLVNMLYTEAMVLADEARAYFEEHGKLERDGLDPMLRVGFSCESLKVTTRLMHVIAWLLTRRAIEAGEINAADARSPARRLGHAADSDAALLGNLPDGARALVSASLDLYQRVKRLDEGFTIDRSNDPGPARLLQERLLNSL